MSNISDLSITFAEVSRASNLTIHQINLLYRRRKIISSKPFKFKFSFSLSDPQVFYRSLFIFLLCFMLLGMLLSTTLEPPDLFVVLTVILIYFFLLYMVKSNFNQIRIFKHFINLYIQILNFNSLIESVEALDEAGRSGGSNRLENREEVIKALTSIRADLISALRIEKAFRENPNFSSSSFTPNLEPLQFLQLSEQSSEYGRLFNEALQIGMNVQEEMQTLQRR